MGEPPSAEYFLVDLATGVVTVKQSLTDHYAPHYVVRVRVRDSAKPDNIAEASVTIPVRRNVHAPQFSQQEYKQVVYENVRVGNSILQLTATDDDDVRHLTRYVL